MANSPRKKRGDKQTPPSPNTTRTQSSNTCSDVDSSSSSSRSTTTSSSSSSSSQSLQHCKGRKKKSRSKTKRKKVKKKRSKKRSHKSKSNVDVQKLLDQNISLMKQLAEVTSMNSKLVSTLDKNLKRESDDTVSSGPQSSNKKHKSDGSTIASHDNETYRDSRNMKATSCDVDHYDNDSYNNYSSIRWSDRNDWYSRRKTNWEWDPSYNDNRRDTYRYSSNKYQFNRYDQRCSNSNRDYSRYVNPRLRASNDNKSCYRSKTDDHGDECTDDKINDVSVPKTIYIWSKKSNQKIRNDLAYGMKKNIKKQSRCENEEKQELMQHCINIVDSSFYIMGKRDISKRLHETFHGYSDIFENDEPLLSKIKSNIKQKLLDIPVQLKTRLDKNGKLTPSNERDLFPWEPTNSDFESDDSSLSAFKKRQHAMRNDRNSDNIFGYYRFNYKTAKGATKPLKTFKRYDSTVVTYTRQTIPNEYLNHSDIGMFNTVALASQALTKLANKSSNLKSTMSSEKEVDATIASSSTMISISSSTKKKSNTDAIIASSQHKSNIMNPIVEVGATIASTSTKLDSSTALKNSVPSSTKQKTNSNAIVASSSSKNESTIIDSIVEVGATVALTSTKLDSSTHLNNSMSSSTKQNSNSDAIVASSYELPSLEQLKKFNYSKINIHFDDGPIGFSSQDEYRRHILEDFRLWLESDFISKYNYWEKHCPKIENGQYAKAILFSLKKVVPIIQEQLLMKKGYYRLTKNEDEDDDDDDDDDDCNSQSDGSMSSKVSMYRSDEEELSNERIVNYYKTELHEKVSNLKLFLCKLKTNTVFDLMIQIAKTTRDVGDIRNKHCFCPCSINMKNWRSSNNIEDDCYFSEHIVHDEFTRCKRNSFISSGLLKHLFDTKCVLHKAIYYFLYSLYNRTVSIHNIFQSINFVTR